LLVAASQLACGGRAIRLLEESGSGGSASSAGSTAAGGSSGRPSKGAGGGAGWSAGGGSGGTAGTSDPGLRRGMNLGNRLDAPYEGAWGPVLHASDFAQIASRGFDHVRLPVRFNAHAAESAPYLLDATFMERVDWAIDQALANGLSIVVDFHHYEEIHENPAQHADRFLGIWDQLADRYQDRPLSVVYELLNEPSAALNFQWNEIAARALQVIRAYGSERLVIVDAVSWADPNFLAQLALPAGDPNVMASIHSYDPVLFTLQGAEFAGPIFSTTGVIYPGPPPVPLTPAPGAETEFWVADWFERYNTLPGDSNPSSPAQVARVLDNAARFMAATGKRVYNGEWGCTRLADPASRTRWMRDVRKETERLGMGWAVWDDGGDISLLNPETGEWNEELLATLFD
jgi:endoglucanase